MVIVVGADDDVETGRVCGGKDRSDEVPQFIGAMAGGDDESAEFHSCKSFSATVTIAHWLSLIPAAIEKFSPC